MFLFALLPHSCISEKCHRGIIDVYLIVFIIAMQLHNGDINNNVSNKRWSYIYIANRMIQNKGVNPNQSVCVCVWGGVHHGRR